MAASPATPAASNVVAHATVEGLLALRVSIVGPLEAAVNSTCKLRENLMDFSTLSSHWSRLWDRNG